MSLITSPEDAAMLNAGRLAAELSERYRFTIEALVEGRDISHALDKRRAELHEASEHIGELARRVELLPREPDLETSELRALADRISSWLDDEQQRRLLERFAEFELELSTELENGRNGVDSDRDNWMTQAAQDARDAAQRLTSL